MLIIRTYLTEIIKSGKFRVNDVFKADFKEVQKLSMPCLRKVVEEFYKNYKNNEEFEKLNIMIMQHLEGTFNRMSNSYKSVLIKNLTFGINKAEFTPGLLRQILDVLTNPKDLYFNKIEASLLIRFLPEMRKNKVEYEDFIRRYFEKMTVGKIKELGGEDLGIICMILTGTGEINKYFDVKIEGISIFSLLEQKYNSNLHQFGLKNEFFLLKCFVINDRGNEDFIRKLEKKVFTEFEDLEHKDLADIAGFYKSRVLHNSAYMMENLFKPLYFEFVKRFDEIDPLTKSTFLLNYWKNSTFFGMFCEGSLPEKLKNMIKQKKYFSAIDSKSRNFLIVNTISYLSHARQLDDQAIYSIIELLNVFSQDFNEKSYCQIMTYISRHSVIDQKFISEFIRYFPVLFKDPEYYTVLYHIYLNLKYRHPDILHLTEKCYSLSNLSILEKHWKYQKQIELSQSSPSQTHNEILSILQKTNIDHFSEFYDDYYIDIAIIKYKICIEISGPGHYLFPALKLNGRTENKLQILQAKGWRYYNFPYFLQKSPKIFLSQIIPLEF
jgi:hypothetical protein